ncbi:MAG TPA: DNA-directed RNA polymerase subunit beta [Planctomycetota bacterium]|nr:DNA-directed RNA polymerase subunit beta [Planctomycetota bacterium]
MVEVKRFGRVQEVMAPPNLMELQLNSYNKFLQIDVPQEEREDVGLESILREIFPIESYDGKYKLEYLGYELGRPRYSSDECRMLRLTYGLPFKIRVRLVKDEPVEEEVYLGEIPRMIGGGEFIINGAERAIVSQLHRSPGVDFDKEVHTSDKVLHKCRIIPERGSWIELNVSKKDTLTVRIDQSGKFPVTTLIRALFPKYATNEEIIRKFYPTTKVKLAAKDSGSKIKNKVVVSDVVDPETGEIKLEGGGEISEKLAEELREMGMKEIEVIDEVKDWLILNTLKEDATRTHEEALLKIYLRLRPGTPPQLEKAKDLFKEKFENENKYRLGRVGRFRINRKFGLDLPETKQTLQEEDFISSISYILKLRDPNSGAELDDIDHLGNRRIRTIDELAGDEFRKGFLKLKRTVQERMQLLEEQNLTPRSIINSKTISSSIDYFFGRGELSQVVDQTNPLAQLTHERRLSALGPGGLNRKRASFEVRDVHISHYGRICPIETPEGTNIGLIASLSIYAKIDEYGFLITPYQVVKAGRVTNEEPKWLRGDEEDIAILAPADTGMDDKGKILGDHVMARVNGEFEVVDPKEIQYIDISPRQLVGVSASLIPFLEHNDANRALMGANMQRQAVPLLKTEPALVVTGMERPVAHNSGMVVIAQRGGTVTKATASVIEVDNDDVYILRKFTGLNERTCLNQKPIVKVGEKVKKGQVLADGAATHQAEMSLGKNVLVAFMPWDGFNFEDAILVSEELLHEDVYTSIHIDEFEIEIRETKLGREEFTRDIPNVSEKALRNLNEDGVIRVGTRVSPGDILVGKVVPKSKSELSPEEKLLHAIFGRMGEDVKNDSLEVPSGVEGIVIDAQKFQRKTHLPEEERARIKKEVRKIDDDYDALIAAQIQKLVNALTEVADGEVKRAATNEVVDAALLATVQPKDLRKFLEYKELAFKGRPAKKNVRTTVLRYVDRIEDLDAERERKKNRLQRGDELPTGVLELVKVYVATRRTLSVGDKMAGRHGNKGVIAKILPKEDMPFLEDGTPVQICLNPLGVPSRMNVGQIMETHLGWAARLLGFQAVTPVFDGASEEQIRKLFFIAEKYRKGEISREDGASLVDVVVSRQDPTKEHSPGVRDAWGEVKKNWETTTGKQTLFDGRTGEKFDQQVTVGYKYMLKLHHLVDDKVHARATGPYSLITQQPLGGKARFGGQRFGEMEVWALEAYGAANILQELLTVKSDDVDGRTKIYESMVKGENVLEPGTPVSFDVLCNEIKGLAINMELNKRGQPAEGKAGAAVEAKPASSLKPANVNVERS